MQIRAMQSADIHPVSTMVMKTFLSFVAKTLPPHGVETFREIASPASLRDYLQADTCILLATEDEAIVGVAALREGRHVGMLFVDPAYQRQGIGKALMEQLLQHRRGAEVTVFASVSSVPAYRSYGFEVSGRIDEKGGIIYQPMQASFASESVQQAG